MIYLTNLLARIWYNSMFEQKYAQYTMLVYAFLILQAYKTLNIKGMNFGHFYRLKCSSIYGLIDVYTNIYHGNVLFLIERGHNKLQLCTIFFYIGELAYLEYFIWNK